MGKTTEQILDYLDRTAQSIAQTFGPSCETLIHDMSKPGHPIIVIYNGHVSGRRTGDTSDIFGGNRYASGDTTHFKPEADMVNTLVITLFAIILSLILGTGIAIVRSTYERNGTHRLLNALCQVYLTIVRGTPTMVQLLIIYYVVFASANVDKILVAIIAFGLNSAAYIAEVVRSGIMSVDNGQMEAGRSLGLTYSQTMRLVVMPQAFKNVLPAIGNELITLLKETSISGYIGLVDLTKGSDIIRSITYDAVLPLGAVALVYLCIVMLLTMGVNKLEKKLRRNER